MEPDDANFDDATLGVVSRYATTRFVFISLLRVHFIATTTTTSQAFFEWFWCLIFPFFSFQKFPISKMCARCCVVSSLFSRPKDDLTSLVFSLSPSQHVQSPSGERPSDQRNIVKTPTTTTDDHQIRLEDDVVSFSSHQIWTDRFATKKF